MISFLTFSLLFTTCSSDEKPLTDRKKKNDLEIENLFGIVKSVNSISYPTQGQIINFDTMQKLVSRFENIYNEKGYLTEKNN